MFEVVFLGTAAGVPAVDRGLPALVVLQRHRRFLLDCGEGTQRQLLESGLGFRRLDCVLLTHAHLDHLLGIGGLLATLALLEAGHSLTVYGGASALRAVRTLLTEVVWPDGRPRFEVRTIVLEPGTIIEDDHLRVRAFPVTHRGAESFGFVFEEKPRPRMLPDKLAALDVPAGPERRRLREGEESSCQTAAGLRRMRFWGRRGGAAGSSWLVMPPVPTSCSRSFGTPMR